MTIARDLSKILDANGDFNIDANTLFVDSSTNSVGIGEASPQKPLHIYNEDLLSGNVQLRIQTGGSGVGSGNKYAGLELYSGATEEGRLFTFNNDLFLQAPISGADMLLRANGGTIQFANKSGYGEALRIDSSGNVLVGKTSIGIGTEGVELRQDRLVVSRDGGSALQPSRLTSDGAIIDLYKDTTQVGSIGTISGTLRVSNDDVGVLFNGAGVTPEIVPANADGSASDNLINLGNSGTRRFKNLYLGGSVYLGGTGSANALDDYEEGTWTPTIVPNTSGTVSLSNANGIYTKIGNFAHFEAYIVVSSISSPNGYFQIQGLPFISNAGARTAGSIVFFNSLNVNVSDFMVYNNASSDVIICVLGDATTQQLDSANQITVGTQLRVTISYRVA